MSVEDSCSGMVPAAEDGEDSEEEAQKVARTASFNLGSSYEVLHRGSSASYRYMHVCEA